MWAKIEDFKFCQYCGTIVEQITTNKEMIDRRDKYLLKVIKGEAKVFLDKGLYNIHFKEAGILLKNEQIELKIPKNWMESVQKLGAKNRSTKYIGWIICISNKRYYGNG